MLIEDFVSFAAFIPDSLCRHDYVVGALFFHNCLSCQRGGGVLEVRRNLVLMDVGGI